MTAFAPYLAALLLLSTPLASGQEPSPAPPAWFSAPVHDAGKRLVGSVVTHVFPFKNPHAESRTIRWMQKTCDCAAATLLIEGKEIAADSVRKDPLTIPALGGGAVKLVISVTEAGSLEGTATLGFGQEDDSPHVVKLRVFGEGPFQVVPPGFSFGELLSTDSRDFSFTVASTYLQRWSITGVGPLPPGLVLSQPQRSETEGRIFYTVRGTIGPNLPPGRAGGVIRLETDADTRPIELNVTAEVKAPYRVTPSGFLHFGLVRRAQGSRPHTIRVEDEDPAHELKLLGVKLEGLNRPSRWIGIERSEPAGSGRMEIVLTILPGAPPGPLRGRLLLELSHPGAPRHTLEFSAVVR